MRRRTALILVVPTCALLITSCKSSNKSKLTTLPAKVSAPATAAATTAPVPATSASGTPTPLPPPATSASATPTASTSPSGSGSPTNLDPCQLVTQGEASTLAGATFGPGKEESTGGGKECVYGSQTTNVMDIIVAQAPDAATAQADYAQAQADVQTTIATNLPPDITAKLNTDTASTAGIGDKAATITGAASVEGQTVSFTGIYVLSGATFFTIGDLVLAKAPPTVTAMQDQAKVTLGRI
jgi:hypothetical protein